MSNDAFSVLYKINVILKIDGAKSISQTIPCSDIVSLSVIHNFDTATFPIIRLRLYSDLSVMENLTSCPDGIRVCINLNANMYNMSNNENDKSPVPVGPASNLTFSLKGYIENKNTPTSVMDQYDHGIIKDQDLNVVRKVPIELYCYNDQQIHFMRSKAISIFKDMSLTTVIKTMFRNQGSVDLNIDPIENQNKWDQVIIPNLNINEALSFLETMYGLYPKGAQVYGDIDKMYISNSDVNNGINPFPIYVESYKSQSDMGGMRKYGSIYQMNTKAENVSVISETDIERVLNAENISSINVQSLEVDVSPMVKLFPDVGKEKIRRVLSTKDRDKYISMLLDKIQVPDILHKSRSPYITSTYNARVSERITKVDLSGVGFDVGKLKINSRYNLIFDSPIRGMSINQSYRANTITHVFSNLDSDLFIAQTTMRLCSN